MKHLFILGLVLILSFVAKGQDLVFKIDQSGTAVKNSKTGRFTDAEVKDDKLQILLQDKLVKISDTGNSSYLLRRMNIEKNSNSTLFQEWQGLDDNNMPVVFKFTVNTQSKTAIVEVAGKQFKNYYFGTYSPIDPLENNVGLIR